MYNDRNISIPSFFKYEKRIDVSSVSGFTLIELIVVMAIVAILYFVATPNFDSVISGSKVDETRLSLATSLALARTEAIKRGENIRVCAGASGVCSGNWNAGWEVLTASNERLQVVEHDSDDASIAYGCGDFVTFNSAGARGSSTSTSTCQYTITKSGISKSLRINVAGRIRMN